MGWGDADTADRSSVRRIRRARAGLAEAERELAAAREHLSHREVARPERELANRRAYLAELVALLRRSAPEDVPCPWTIPMH
jgi:hypothetical protein